MARRTASSSSMSPASIHISARAVTSPGSTSSTCAVVRNAPSEAGSCGIAMPATLIEKMAIDMRDSKSTMPVANSICPRSSDCRSL